MMEMKIASWTVVPAMDFTLAPMLMILLLYVKVCKYSVSDPLS